jgi:UDP-N-acetylglucosamine 2-epimerase (non-hydrolysing)
MRDNTERQEGIESGCAILAGVKKESITSAFNSLMSDKDLYRKMSNNGNPYGNGTASNQIVSIIQGQILRK